ncbi:pleckstrin homology domain-containing family G member 3 isoform X2 [Anguilla anguilla]|uniref:pleckstrin homology domain-containing family G member 3 isoform X2 n=1 Tax=Anguilla anguilla TaxID=7936 RepID=UPI0015B1ED8B|nr:pleckstrin homology domain-containing family G member 3 isoform X2 [Anguilla anguilla]
MSLLGRTKEWGWGLPLRPGVVDIAGSRNVWEERTLLNGLNRRISRWFESPRLSTASSVSSNERMSTATMSDCSASLSADLADGERPVSLVSTLSSGSSRDGQSLYGSTAALPGAAPCPGDDIDLELSPAGGAREQQQQQGHVDPGETRRRGFPFRQSRSPHNNAGNPSATEGANQPSTSPFAAKAMAPNPKLTYVDRVVMEIIETERMYVRDLRSIVEDYLAHIIDTGDLPMRPEQVSDLFGNIEDIYEFNSELLQTLDMCENDPVAIARCFVDKSQDFEIYTQYCTNYPNSVAALTDCMRSKALAKFFRDRQASLKRSLPLGSYLLKPVQRILKYHLLLQEIAKHFDPLEEGYEVIEEAIDTMTGVAWYINDMKRKHEHAVRLQEVQSLLINWKGPDLTTYGELVLEGTFRVHRARKEKTLFLFEKMLIFTKKRGEHYVYKSHFSCSTLMLIESTKDSLCFSIAHFKHPKQPQTVQAKTVEEKRLWAHHIKRLILENHHAIIPQKAKEAILEMDSIYPSKYRYSPERMKKAVSCQSDDFTGGGRQGRRQSEPAKQIIKNTIAILKHADSEGTLQAPRHSLQAGASVSTLGSSLGEPEAERPSVEDDEEELGQRQDSPERLSPSDSEEPRPGTPPCVGGVEQEEEEGESDKDDILMGDDQDEDGCDVTEEHELKMENDQSSGQEETCATGDGDSPAEQSAGEQPPSQSGATEECEEGASSDIEHVAMATLSPDSSADPEMVKREEEQGEDEEEDEVEKEEEVDEVEKEEEDEEEKAETLPIHQQANVKALSSGESSEEEEEEAAPEAEPSSILPQSVLDQASIIAERFVSLSRRGSLIADDVRSLSCPSPRLGSRSSSALSLSTDPQDKTQRLTSTTSEPPLSLHDLATPTADANPFSPSSDNLVEVDRGSLRRRDSTLSKQDQLLINKVKSYYEHAEHQDASFSIKRRESLSYIPTGLVRNLSSRLNGNPKAEAVATETRLAPNIRPASWAVFNLPGLDKDQKTKPSEPDADMSVEGPTSKARSQSVKEEEFRPSSEMIKVWQDMEMEVNGTLAEPLGASKAKEGGQGREAGPSLSQRDSSSNNKPEAEYSEPLMILEECDLSTISEESTVPSPVNASPDREVGPDQPASLNETRRPQRGSRVSRAPIPRVISLRGNMEEDLLLQDVEKMKNKVFQLARQYSQRIKNSRPVVRPRCWDVEGQFSLRNLPSVQEERLEKEDRGHPNLTLPVTSYDQVILQELKSPSPVTTPRSAGSPHILSPRILRSKSPLSPVEAESFNWPDVRRLRSRYARRSPERTPPRLAPVNRSTSVPEKMLDAAAPRSMWRHSSYSPGYSAPLDTLTASDTPSVVPLYKPHQDKASAREDRPMQMYRSSSLDQRLGTLDVNELNHLQSNDATSGYYISGQAPLPDQQKVIIVEKHAKAEPSEEEREGDGGLEIKDEEEPDKNYVQIHSPTSREKISIMAVIDRCRAYQESDEYRQREDGGGNADQATKNGKVTDQGQGPIPNELDSSQHSPVNYSKKTENSQHSLVKNLREKFQNLSSNPL